MPTSFEVIFLGTLPRIDTTQGNEVAENAAGILGTYGSAGAPLNNNVQFLTAVRLSEDANDTYDTDNGGGFDRFRINGGGPPQNFDAVATYNAVITYVDGTTATITATVFQDVSGNTYLAPEEVNNADQFALTAAPILSLNLISVVTATGDMLADRVAGDFKTAVDGTAGNDNMALGSGYTDAQGDQITTGNDYIIGGDGNDTINADAGNDTVLGGAGNDIIDDWGGNDLVYAGSGNDRVDLSIGNDTIFMEDGDDTVRVWDNAGTNSLNGGSGNDLLDFTNFQSSTGATVTVGPDGSGSFSHFSGGTTGTFTGFETISGTAFNDRMTASSNTTGIGLSGEAGNDVLIGGSGQDQIDGGDGEDFVDAGGGNDSVTGGSGNDVVFGDEGNDTVNGGLGNDTIYGGGGADSITGGDGNDRIFGDNTTAAPVTVTNGTFATGTTAGWTVTGAGTSVDNQALAFNAGNNFYGGTAQQTVATQIGFDYQLSFNTFENGSGSANHTLVVEVIDANGQVIGTQTIIVTNGSNQVITVNFTATTANTTLRFSNPTSTGTSSTDVLIDNVTVTGLATPTTTGNDTINAGEGSDFVDAGGGDDLVTIDGTFLGDDTLDGGAGNDTLVLAPDDNRLLFVDMSTGVTTDWNPGSQVFTNFENLITADGNDSVTGTSGANFISTQGGNDTVLSGDGNDTVEGGDGDDSLLGGTGDDSILGGAGNDTIVGGSPTTMTGPNLIVNGSFEGGLANNSYAYYMNGALAGWQSSSGIIEVQSNGLDGNTAADGSNWAEIDADTAVDNIFQDVTTPAGESLTLTFEAQQRFSGSTDSIEVWFGGVLIDTITPATNSWQTYSYTVTASGTDRLEFRELASQNSVFGPLIDNVSLTAQILVSSDDTLSGGDGDDSLLGEGGDDQLFGDAGNDTLLGGDGNDTLFGGDGNDTLIAGNNTGAGDSLSGGAGNDYLVDSFWNATLDGGTGSDIFELGYGNATVIGGEDAGNTDFDLIDFQIANDAVNILYTGDEAGTYTDSDGDSGQFSQIEGIILTDQADTVNATADTSGVVLIGNAGNDLLTGGQGDDFIEGGIGDDTLTGNAGLDTISGDDGADQIQGGQGGDSLSGGAGSDFILGDGQWYAIGDYASPGGGAATTLTVTNTADGPIELWWIDGSGTMQFYATIQPGQTYVQPTFDNHNWVLRDDQGYFLELIEGAANQIVTYGAEGLADSIAGGEGSDTILGQYGDDTIDGGGEADVIFAGSGNDSVRGGDGNDVISGGEGRDTLIGGAGADTLTGGAGADRFIVDAGGDIITDFDATTGIQGGGTPDQTDNDFVDLSAYYNETTLAAWNAANPGNTYLRPIDWLRADHADDGALAEVGGLQIRGPDGQPVDANQLNFENTNVVCFANGTRIATAKGAVLVEDLMPGDLVMTMDHGLQPLRWVGSRSLGAEDFRRNPNLRPIRLSAGALGMTDAVGDLVVSPQHRIMIASPIAQRMCGCSEVLVAAKDLLGMEGVRIAEDIKTLSYFHLLFDDHEIIFANSIPAESLYLGKEARKALSPEGLAEIQVLFPEIAAPHFTPVACRPMLSGHRARKLSWRHMHNRKPLIDRRLAHRPKSGGFQHAAE